MTDTSPAAVSDAGQRLRRTGQRPLDRIAADLIEALAAERDALSARIATMEDEYAAMEQKLDALAPHTCACSIDTPDDMCLHHSPKLAAMTAERDALAAKLAQVEQKRQESIARANLDICDVCAERDAALAVATEFWSWAIRCYGEPVVSAISRVGNPYFSKDKPRYPDPRWGRPVLVHRMDGATLRGFWRGEGCDRKGSPRMMVGFVLADNIAELLHIYAADRVEFADQSEKKT